jgi:tRNA nucleotidyltransferase (CCA-adding enzyme)
MSMGAAGNASGGGAGAEVLEALADLPGGRELLALASRRDDVGLVGGAVRDLLLGRLPRELDVVVEGSAGEFAHALASSLTTPGGLPGSRGPTAIEHGRFGTASVRWDGGRIDVAERRSETYPAPGSLPDVRPGSMREDLLRRDFTVNAIAIPLGGSHRGELLVTEHSLEDLETGRLRVLHEQSFLDDPTRLLRLARYSARLGFQPQERTAELAAEALAAGALSSVSRARIGAELRLGLAEDDCVAALGAMSRLGLLTAIEGHLQLDEGLARRALALLPADGRPDLLLMASLMLPLSIDPAEDPEPVIFELLDGLEFTSGDRHRVMRTALVAPGLFKELALASKPSEMHEALWAHTTEAIALGGAMGEGTASVTTEAEIWFERLRHVRLQITGQDLLDAGIPSGPQIGRRLSRALARRLDGELMPGAEAELQAALDASP